MALKAEYYYRSLQKHLPQGAAWPSDDDTPLNKLLLGLAQELARIDTRGHDLLREADPRTTYEMLSDWETAAGLPEECWLNFATDLTETRRTALLMRVLQEGGQSKAYFLKIAAILGYPNATITERVAASCTSSCAGSLNTATAGWPFVWQLNLPATLITVATCTGSCQSVLREWGDDILECVMNRLKPAQTHIVFSYGGQ